MKTRKLCACACLTAAALGVFVLECQLPPISVLPGLKPGLSNIFTLVCMDLLGPGWALGLLLARILLGCALTGRVSAALYALSGGLAAFLPMALLRRRLSGRFLWVKSVFCALAHNLGQLLAAAWAAGTWAVFWYLPALELAGLFSGALTGLCAQLCLQRLSRAHGLRLFHTNSDL